MDDVFGVDDFLFMLFTELEACLLHIFQPLFIPLLYELGDFLIEG